jgi:hypothetical protein
MSGVVMLAIRRTRELFMPETPQRKLGFPLHMLIGFCIGASVATVIAFVLSENAGRFSYTLLFDFVAPLGGIGAYIGHVVGAARNKEAGFQPLGPLTPGVLMVGGGIVLVGTIVVLAAVMGIMTVVKGHPPPH